MLKPAHFTALFNSFAADIGVPKNVSETNNMKRIFLSAALISAIIYALSCSKANSSGNTSSCSGSLAVTDTTALLAFASQHGITTTVDTSWLYYQIIVPGSGASPGPTSKVFIRYAARFMDGSYLDSSGVSTRFAMDSLIKGLQYGLPKIKSGGEIKLLVPAALAYGCVGTAVIPPDAPLYFNVYLDSLQ